MLHIAGDAMGLVADLFEAGGGVARLVEKGAIGGADAARRELLQPGAVGEALDQLDAAIGDAAALGGLQQAVVVLRPDAGIQRVHDAEDGMGVVGIAEQLAHRAERGLPVAAAVEVQGRSGRHGYSPSDYLTILIIRYSDGTPESR
ncbi:MAG: hypothetical protein WDM81_17030 [Rhizomicrobium sp.]